MEAATSWKACPCFNPAFSFSSTHLTVTPPYLSIVIPAHNEEFRLPPSLEKIHAFLQSQPYPAEVVVVENGSRDRTLEITREYARKMPTLRVISETKRGKGLAVRRGMLEAQGEYRFICDADLSMPIDQVNRFLPPSIPHPDVVIGSREVAGAVRYHEPAYRHLIGRGFNTIVRWVALPGLQDTQCGFKCFRARAAEEVFSRQTLTGMSFDVEVLFVARRLGYKIEEVPIDWYFDPDSRVRLIEDSLRMFLDLLTIRRNARRGVYDAQVRPR
jgi:glycosyltransferase involved in cell wall biosynthesis